MLTVSDDLLTLPELASKLKMSKHAAYELTRGRASARSDETIPCIRISRKCIRFSWPDVVAWLNAKAK